MTSTYLQIPKRLMCREDFQGHSMQARGGGAPKDRGRLNDDEWARLQADADRIVYVVFSYYTPIAWMLDDGSVYVTSQQFSTTTSRHQHQCLAWLR